MGAPALVAVDAQRTPDHNMKPSRLAFQHGAVTVKGGVYGGIVLEVGGAAVALDCDDAWSTDTVSIQRRTEARTHLSYFRKHAVDVLPLMCHRDDRVSANATMGWAWAQDGSLQLRSDPPTSADWVSSPDLRVLRLTLTIPAADADALLKWMEQELFAEPAPAASAVTAGGAQAAPATAANAVTA
jgi:hypothetical protein